MGYNEKKEKRDYMSTTIYNGYYLDESYLHMGKLQKFMKKVQEKIRPLQKEIMKKQQASILQDLLVHYYFESTERFQNYCKEAYGLEDLNCSFSFLSKIGLKHKEKQLESKNLFAESAYNLKIELVCIPIQNKVLILYYGEHPEFRDVVESFPEIFEYNYWNNVDQPEELSDEEWEQRKKDWDVALPGLGIPSEEGLIFSINKPSTYIQNTELLPYVNDFSFHLREYTERELEKTYYRKYPVSDGADAVEYSRKYREFKKWLKTEEGIIQYNEKINELKGVIPSDVTQEIIEKKAN